MRIAITGASGFVGTNLENYFELSHEVEPMSVRYLPNQKLELNADAIIYRITIV